MNITNNGRPWEILLVEDNHGDIVLVQEALEESEIEFNMHSVTNGAAALDYLKGLAKNTKSLFPDLILLDLNLPRVDGKEVLKEIKNDDRLEAIPVIVLTSSQAEADVYECYKLKANSYVTKPVDFEEFIDVVSNIKEYWLSIVKLPTRTHLI